MNCNSLIDSTQMEEDWGTVSSHDDLPSINPGAEEQGDEMGNLEEEFSFCSLVADQESTIAADDIFEDGRIRPLFPLFVRDNHAEGELTVNKLPSLKVFVEKEEPEGPFCEWDGKSPRRPVVVVDASPGTCKKSNSTGFSKLLKFRELMIRSNSDGKDAFVFLSPGDSSSKSGNGKKTEETETKKKTGVALRKKITEEPRKKTETTSFSAHYKRNRASRDVSKRVSYLPYRVGFFTDVNGLSKNVHPF